MRDEFDIIFVNGRQKRVKREPHIDGMPADEFVRRNADQTWLLQNEMYELLETTDNESHAKSSSRDELPF